MQYIFSKNEIAYLTGSKEFTGKQRRDIKYRLNQKLRLLNNNGDDDDDSRGGAAEFRGGLPALGVAQAGRALPNGVIEKERIMRSLGRELNPRPLPLGSRLFEPYLTKVTLYQAELPRQLNEQSSQ